jgi:ribosome assembly protein RRB1
LPCLIITFLYCHPFKIPVYEYFTLADEDDLPENQPQADDEDYEDLEDEEEEDGDDENESGEAGEEKMPGKEEWVSDDGDDNMVDEESKQNEVIKKPKSQKKVQIKEDPKMEQKNKVKEKVVPFLDSSKKLKEGEYLDFDNSAYEMMHRANTDW